MAIEFNYLATVELDADVLQAKLETLIEEEGFELGELTVQFVSDDYLLEMNRDVLNHDYYTDIITMDYCVSDLLNGDLFISVDRVRENAESLEVPFLDELFRVVIHGVLHLCGYGDATDEEKAEMRALETHYLTFKATEES